MSGTLPATLDFHQSRDCSAKIQSSRQIGKGSFPKYAKILKASPVEDAMASTSHGLWVRVSSQQDTVHSSSSSVLPTISLNALFASQNNLSPLETVYVEFHSKSRRCLKMEVEPLSSEDWEIVALNAGKIEEQLLGQLQVVQENMVFPLWIDQSLCVFLRAVRLEPAGSDFLELSEGSEVLVAPFSAPHPPTQSIAPTESLAQPPTQATTAEEEPKNEEDLQEVPQINQALIDESALFLRNIVDSDGKLRPLKAGAHLLICGPKFSGKTHLSRSICRELYRKHYVYYAELDCRTLRGKKIETVEKRIRKLLAECSRPSVLLLDDLDQLCPNLTSMDQLAPGSDLVANKLVRAILGICGKIRGLSVIGTAKHRSTIHPGLVPVRGKRFFTKILTIPPMNLSARVHAFETLGCSHLSKSELSSLGKQTEGYVIGDLKRLVAKARLSKDPATELELGDMESGLADFQPLNLHNARLNSSPLTKGWKDIGGLANVKQILIETVLWPSMYPTIFGKCPLRLARGILLHGPSGTGKTLLASALAKESGLNFINIKGPELLSKYIGASEESVRETFARARSAKPSLLFFDEFDSLAPRRGHDSTGVTDRVVNQLLTELDGVEGLEGVFVVVASSRPDLLDPALLRPGRIDRHILCSLPDQAERLEILGVYTRDLMLDEGVDLSEFASRTDGFTGADLRAFISNAHLIMSSSHGAESRITNDVLDQALEETSPSSRGLSSQPITGLMNQKEMLQKLLESTGNRVSLA